MCIKLVYGSKIGIEIIQNTDIQVFDDALRRLSSYDIAAAAWPPAESRQKKNEGCEKEVVGAERRRDSDAERRPGHAGTKNAGYAEL